MPATIFEPVKYRTTDVIFPVRAKIFFFDTASRASFWHTHILTRSQDFHSGMTKLPESEDLKI
jgi:hypothetical protein